MTKQLVSSTQYYDQISEDYDSIMDHKRVEIVRSFIKNYCLNFIKKGIVLDFGAGTGEDTNWHLELYEKVIFYEPSSEMASVAKDKIDPSKNYLVDFIVGDHATLDNIGKYNNIDLVFSNFAVFNSIENPLESFNVFRKILNPDGNLIIVLYERRAIMHTLKRILSGAKQTTHTSEIKTSAGSKMKVYFHQRRYLLAQAETAGYILVMDKYFKNGAFRMYHFKLDS